MINDLLCLFKERRHPTPKKKLINFGKFWKVVEETYAISVNFSDT